MTTTSSYIKEWQLALQAEIQHLKKYGSSKYRVHNGYLLSQNDAFVYFFETSISLNIPVGSLVRLSWGDMNQNGRVLSSEGKSIIVSLEQFIGDLISEAVIYHDPWELLDQLIQRLEDIKKSKRKRTRIKKLMEPTIAANHPTENIKSNIHELVLRSKYNPVTFVWGPPGTGKTYTLARVAANKYFKGKKVLILSHSNQAVDVLILEISQFIRKMKRFKEGELLRYGTQTSEMLTNYEGISTGQLLQRYEPELADDRDELMEQRRLLKKDLSASFSKRDSNELLKLETKISKVLEKIRQVEMELVKNAQVVGTTLAKAASDPAIYEKDFDVVILDEASMAYVPQAALAASLGKRVIICGDFKQLPPIAASKLPIVTKWLKEDIFHRTGVSDAVEEGKLHPHLFLLNEQRRMHPDISAFTNKYIYHSLVGDHESVQKSRNKITALAPFPNQASILLDTSETGEYCINERTSFSRMNPWHLFISFQLIHEAFINGARSIGYVTPYRAQATLMDSILNDLYEKERSHAEIISATVHRFQGSERDVMIFDTVDSYPQQRAGMLLTGQGSERLINVAITRTKGKFINLANQSFIQSHVYKGKTIRSLTDFQIKKNQRIGSEKVGAWIKNQHPRLQWIYARKEEQIFSDIQTSRKSIILSLPIGIKLSAGWVEQLNQRKKQVKLTIISEKNWEVVNHEEWLKESLPFPFLIIDQRFLWLGVPFEGFKRLQPPYISARLDSESVTTQFLDQLPIK